MSAKKDGSGQPTMKGYLSKEGKVVHSIRKRYFQLWANPPFFSYYQSQGGAHIKTVRIEGADNHVMINPEKPNAFFLITGDRKWSFVSESGHEMSAWVRHLTEACDDARRKAFNEGKSSKGEEKKTLRVLVAGSASPVCAAAVLSLVKHHPNVRVRAYVNINRIVANFLDELANVEMVYIDSDDPRTLEDAFTDVDTLIADLPHDRSIETALAYIGAAKKANLKLFCVLIPPVSGLTPHVFSQYRQIERDLKGSALPFCMLRTNHLMDTQLDQIGQLREHKSILSPPISPEMKISWVSSFDVGVCAAAVAVAPDDHKGRRYSITGTEAYSYANLAGMYTELLGEEIKVNRMDEEGFVRLLQTEKGMTRWAAEGTLELFTQGDRFKEYCEREREEKKKMGKPEKKDKTRRKITPYELAGVSNDFASLSTAGRCDMRAFMSMLIGRYLSEQESENQAEWVLPLLAPASESLLPDAPPFFFEDLQEEVEEDQTPEMAASPKHRTSVTKSAEDRISIPSSEILEGKGIQVYNIKVMNVDELIQKRFSAFHEFAKEIHKRFPDVHYPDLPGKKYFASQETVELRRVGFQSFLLALVNQEKVWPELSHFLGVNIREKLGMRVSNIRTVRSISQNGEHKDGQSGTPRSSASRSPRTAPIQEIEDAE